MNQVTIMGRLTRDPDIRHTTEGKKTASFALAVERQYSKTTDFVPCIAWEKKADFAENYLRRGMKVLIVGELHIRSYEKNGEKRIAPEVVVDKTYFCESKKDGYEDLADDLELPF